MTIMHWATNGVRVWWHNSCDLGLGGQRPVTEHWTRAIWTTWLAFHQLTTRWRHSTRPIVCDFAKNVWLALDCCSGCSLVLTDSILWSFFWSFKEPQKLPKRSFLCGENRLRSWMSSLLTFAYASLLLMNRPSVFKRRPWFAYFTLPPAVGYTYTCLAYQQFAYTLPVRALVLVFL
jgi:hypothetical protein